MSPDRLRRITVEKGKYGGRPCIRKFRIRVTHVLPIARKRRFLSIVRQAASGLMEFQAEVVEVAVG